MSIWTTVSSRDDRRLLDRLPPQFHVRCIRGRERWLAPLATTKLETLIGKLGKLEELQPRSQQMSLLGDSSSTQRASNIATLPARILIGVG
jgi:hypothetical protein